MSELTTDHDGQARCGWCSATEDFFPYHDREWGFPVDNDQRLFEKLCLESFQSGLSWRTILTKRENFRQAFCQFDFYQMAKFNQQNIEKLVNNKGIIRHRGKIEAVINNAARAIEIVEEFGSLAALIWSYEIKTPQIPPQSRSTSEESVALSKWLKKRGWKFVSPTTIYAFMQAMGLLNDHLEGCISRPLVAKARANFMPPKIINTK